MNANPPLKHVAERLGAVGEGRRSVGGGAEDAAGHVFPFKRIEIVEVVFLARGLVAIVAAAVDEFL